MPVTATAHQKFIRQTPRKVRLVANTLRGKKVDEALQQLQYSPKRAAEALGKVVRQAQANAINNAQAKPDSLTIKEIEIQEGPMLKRWQAVSRGRAHSIQKRMSHIKITVAGENQ